MAYVQSGLWGQLIVLCALFVTSQGGCELPSGWGGQWFQLGSGKTSLSINGTHIESKGECVQSEGDKFVLYDRTEKCYRCIVMHKKHNNVLQYKETYCMPDDDLPSLCNEINGDATLLSMFRVDAQGVACPFKSPPFSVVYSKGHGDCGAPASRAEPCTDDTRLVFRFQACPDIPGTEAGVEELECLATWREGTFHYLVGRLHHKMATVDEERYRCFVYHKQDHTYQVAQSGEATCSGLLTPYEGSRNMKLTKIEGQHTRCKFPTWVTQHYHWRSLDYSHSFHFSHRNASLKITTSRTGVTETKLMCHYVETEKSNMARIVVHVISGCDGGYRCMTLHKRDSHVIQMQQSEDHNDPAEACRTTTFESSSSAKTITMITGTLPSVKCPMEGRYVPSRVEPDGIECTQQTSLQRLLMACSPNRDTMEFEPTCKTIPKTSYSCHGSWRENSTTYVVGSPDSRHSVDARHYCFIFSPANGGLTVERVAETCALATHPSDWTFNITETGKCAETNSGVQLRILPLLAVLTLSACVYHTLVAR